MCCSATAASSTCTPHNEHARPLLRLSEFLRHARLCAARARRTVPVKPYVRCSTCASPTRRLLRAAAKPARPRRGRLRRRHGVLAAEDVPHPRHVRGQAPFTSDYTYENIYYRSIAREARGLPHGRTTTSGAGTPTGSGARRTCCAQNPLRAPDLRPAAPGLAHLHEDHALEQPRRRDEEARARARPAFRVGDPGRRHPDRPRRGVPRVLRARDRPLADVDLPHRPRARRASFALYPCGTTGTSTSASGT